jgi:hypothetical protein
MGAQTQMKLSPSAQAFMDEVRAQAGGKHPPPTPTPASPPSGGSGGSHGSSGNSGGGTTPPGTGPLASSGSSSGEGSNFAVIIPIIIGAIATLCTLYLTVWQTATPEGVKSREQNLAIVAQEKEKEKIEAQRKLVIAQTRFAEEQRKSAAKQQSIAPATTPACQQVATSTAKRRVDAVTLSYGQCVEFVASATDRWFWVILSSAPTSIEGQASFAQLRDEMEEDKSGRRTQCMKDTNDAEFCDKEMKISRGVRIDDCVTKFTQDRCLSYLKGKSRMLPIVVNTSDRVRITM